MSFDFNFNVNIRVVSLPDNVNQWLTRSLHYMSQNSDNIKRISDALDAAVVTGGRIAEDIRTLATANTDLPELGALALRMEAFAASLKATDDQTANPGDPQPGG